MNLKKCPLSVLILGCVFIGAGAIGFAYHLTDFPARGPFPYDLVWAELIEMLAIILGIFMIIGRNWSRWGALAWIAFHVILSAFHTFGEFAVHALFLAVIAWILFRPEAARYFRGARAEPT